MPDFPSIQLRKANGESEPYDAAKLRRSLERARVPLGIQDEAIQHVEASFRDGTSSQEVYSQVQEVIKQRSPGSSCRYGLKRAIMNLGPSGFPFEKYIGQVLRHYEFQVAVDTMVRGKCVSHEVDVLASKDGHTAIIECKFHNEPGSRSDVKVALYVYARFLDIAAHGEMTSGATQNPYKEVWLITNTKCTSDALAYAECVGMRVIGWNYPKHGNLQELIELSGLYPITCLPELSGTEREALLRQDIVLVQDVPNRPELKEMVMRS